jgi:hypothetical protein
MGFFKEKRNQYLDEFDEEQRLYEAAAKEFDDGESHPELRAKVLSEAYGSMDFARTSFIAARVQMLLQENGDTAEAEAADITDTQNETVEGDLPSPTVPQQDKPAKPVANAKTVGGYFSLLLGLTLLVVALLYLSVGGTRTGVSILLVGAITLLLGLALLKPFSKKSAAS